MGCFYLFNVWFHEAPLVVSNSRNDGTRNGGTTERETTERDFFLFFFFKKKKKKKKQQRKSKYISQNKGHAYILYPSKSI